MTRRILFVAETVTLAHLARPLAISASLDRQLWEPVMACDQRHAPLVEQAGQAHFPLHSISSAEFLAALAAGRPLYSVETLARYVEDDLALLRRVAPSLVIGDFRLSLSVSARVAGIPYVSISSAYWSPHYRPPRWPVPSLLSGRIPLSLLQAIFDFSRPIAFRLHARPLERIRQRYGLPSLDGNLRKVYTDADYVMYGDLPELFPMMNLPPQHGFVGPILWEPEASLPSWWNEVPKDRPLLYITLGSSGRSELLQEIVLALAALPVTILVATAGRTRLDAMPSNVYTADFLPGVQASRRASLVICNGGSLTVYQALAAGVPVLGIAGNLDQFLNMDAVARQGAGRILRADRVRAATVAAQAKDMLTDAACGQAARAAQNLCSRHRLEDKAPAFLNNLR